MKFIKQVRNSRDKSPKCKQNIKKLLKVNSKKPKLLMYQSSQPNDTNIQIECSNSQFKEENPIAYIDYKQLLQTYPKKVDLSKIQIHRILGKGNFGAVYLVENIESKEFWALKSLSKADLVDKKQVDHIKNEIFLLSSLENQFIVKQIGFQQDNNYLYHIMEYIPGGDFYQFLKRIGKISIQFAAFYTAQIVIALNYLHTYKIAYRDLKPENILLDKNGYIKIADFGFVKQITNRTYTICGTREYIAPEILINMGHDCAVDWWSLGVFLYEIIVGKTPFYADSPIQVYENIVLQNYSFPKGLNSNARSLIKHLLERDLSKRYGNLSNGVQDIKNHAFFDCIDWELLEAGQIEAPFIPELDSECDSKYFDYLELPSLENRTLDQENDPFFHWQLIFKMISQIKFQMFLYSQLIYSNQF